MHLTRRQVLLLLGLIPILFMAVFYVLPLGVVFEETLQGMQQTLGRADLLGKIAKPLGFTIYQALLSTILTVLVGFPIAYVFSHLEFKGKRFFNLAVTLPFILPTVVVAAALNSLFGSHGWVNILLVNVFHLQEAPLQWTNTLGIILVAHVFYNTSVFVRMVGAAWAQLDVQQEQAARVLGANAWQRFRRVTLPLLKPSILSALLMVFLFDFTSFGVILLLGGPSFSTLEVEIYKQTTQMLDLPMAGILSTVQLVITFCIAALTMRWGKSGNVSFLPDIKNERLHKPNTLFQKTLLVILLVFIVLFFILPEVSLLLRSLVRMEADRTQLGQITGGFTLDFYKELFQNTRRSLFYVPPIQALKNSILYALTTTLIAGVLGVISAYALTKMRRSGLLRSLVILPLGTSSVTLGLGFLLTFTRLPFFQEYPQVLVPVAHALIALPLVINTLTPAFSAIPAEMHAAASSLGAAPLKILFKIDLPLVRRPLLVGVLYAFILSLGEFGATSFLTRPAYPTLPVAIYRYLDLPGAMNYGQAMAMACILMLACALSMGFMDKLAAKERAL